MNWLKGLLSEIGQEISGVFYNFDSMDAFSLILLLSSLIIITALIVRTIKYRGRKRRLTVFKSKNYLITRITNVLSRKNAVMKVLNNITIKLSMMNSLSYEKNQENAVVLSAGAILFLLLSVFLFIPTVNVVWYVALTYILMSIAFVIIAFIIFTFIARLRFTSKLPGTYKILNSRYITSGNILKAISASMEDFDKSVKREMHKIHNILKKNNMAEIDETFRRLENAYKNEYLTLLLNLIIQAHYKGGDAAIKRQFENTTEEILTDIENQKDLSFTARIYMLLAVILPAGVKWLEGFNQNALGAKAAEFYASPLGIEIKLLFFFAFFFYLGILLFMERTA
ncbi:MAG: hypothetical protein N3I35_11585 [Clostridia bacterium]|nr:hypothetical protein [Clostridia bacterium]